MTSYCPSISQEICQNISCIGSPSPHHKPPTQHPTTQPPHMSTHPLSTQTKSFETQQTTLTASTILTSLETHYMIFTTIGLHAFQGPIYSAHKPAISPEQTNHVSDTIQEAHQMTATITPLHLLPPTTQHQPNTPHSPPAHT